MAFKFGDVIENAGASHDNPLRRGFYVRDIVRGGRLNSGVFVELTNGLGTFWTHAKNSGALTKVADSKISAHQ